MGKPLGRKLRELFFTEQEAGGARVLRCRCGQALSPASRGFKAVIAHVVAEHDNWLASVVRDGRVVPDEFKGEPIVQAPAAAASTETEAAEEHEDESSEIDAPASAVAEAEVVEVMEVKAPAKKPGTTKRVDYLPWDDYFMSVAFLSAMRSKDPSTQVGACIVSPEKKIVGIGYNGFPNGCDDDHLPWARSTSSGSPLETKYPYVCHAEMNAILNKNSTDVKGCTIYVALFPCNECAKLIIQSGIARVVYCSDKYRDDWKFEASRRLLDMANVKYSQHKLRQTKLVIDFSSVE